MKIYIKILFAALVVGIIVFLCFNLAAKPVRVLTDKSEYRIGDTVEVTIENKLGKTICFSSCYPYSAEKQDQGGEWKEYSYSECAHDFVTTCAEPGVEKRFRLSLDEAEAGINRLKIPVCVECQGQVFSAEFTYHSNNFEVK